MQLWITTTIDDPGPVVLVNEPVFLEELGRFEFDPRTSGFAIRCVEYSAYSDEPGIQGVEYTNKRGLAEYDDFGKTKTRALISLALFARSVCDARRLTRMRFENLHFGAMPGAWLEFWRGVVGVDYLVHRITELVFDSCSLMNNVVLNFIRSFDELRTLSICNFIEYRDLGDHLAMEVYLADHKHLEDVEFTSRDVGVTEATAEVLMSMSSLKRFRLTMDNPDHGLIIHPYDAASDH